MHFVSDRLPRRLMWSARDSEVIHRIASSYRAAHGSGDIGEDVPASKAEDRRLTSLASDSSMAACACTAYSSHSKASSCATPSICPWS